MLRPRIFHGGVVDGHDLPGRHVDGPAAFLVHHLVPDADVRERAAHHDLVVAAPRAVRVEVLRLNSVLDQVLAGRAVLRDRAGGRNVVGRDEVAEHAEDARRLNVRDGRGLAGTSETNGGSRMYVESASHS